MNTDISVVLKKIKTFLRFSGKGTDTYESEGINPRKDWAMFSTVLLIVLCVGFIFAYYFDIQVSQGKLFSTTPEDNTERVVINGALLKKTITDMDIHRTNMENLQKNSISIPDPSL